jgi:hypothetical protein
LLDAAADFVDDLGAQPDHVEGVQHGDRIREAVADRVVESGRGAVSSVSAGPFPRPAPRTGRATSTASGSPQGAASKSADECGCHLPWCPRVGMAVPR